MKSLVQRGGVLNNFSGGKKDIDLIGTLSGGGIPVNIESIGSITLAFK